MKKEIVFGKSLIQLYMDAHPNPQLDLFMNLNYDIVNAVFMFQENNGISDTSLARVIGVSMKKFYKMTNGDYNFSLKELAKIFTECGLKVKITIEDK
jgi:DNA-binding XRE family transcriptional regulator